MNLYILRHAPAVPRGTRGYARDSDRPLTPDGAKKMRAIAKGMRTLKLSCDVILSSPYVRARHTAEIAAAALGMKKKLKFSAHLASNGSPENLIRELRAKYRSFDSVVLVGHEPYLSRLVAVLISGGPDVSLSLKKGGLCKLSTQALRYGRCATLEWLLTPRQLVRLGKA